LKLTKRSVEALVPGSSEVVVWDEQLPSFGVRVKASGVRSYVVQYRNISGRSRRLTLGRHGVITADQARRRAQVLLAEVAGGHDPVEKRSEQRRAGTVAELAERYLTQHALPRKKASSIRSDRWLLDRHILPRLGGVPVTALTRQDVAALHHGMRATPHGANRARALLSKMMNLAEKWGIRADGSNPCRHIEPYPETKRRRFLSAAELARLGTALSTAERAGTELRSSIVAIRLLLFTGAREGEILGLRWDHVDLERDMLRLPDSKTGAKEIPLNAPALAVLRGIDRGRSPWVIPGKTPDAPLVGLPRAWRRIRSAARIPDARIHDLRRTAASAGASVGVTLEAVGQILGHSQAATTKRYAFLFDDAKREGAERIGSWLEAALLDAERPAVPLQRALSSPRVERGTTAIGVNGSR
jgi:integrase